MFALSFLPGLVLGACFMELRWEYHYALRWVRFLPRVSRKGFTQTFNIAMSNNNNTQLAAPVAQGQYLSMLTAFESFPQLMQVADALAHSSIVPQCFQNDPGSVMIALDMAARSNLNPLMVMQNLYTVYGTPSFSGKFALTLLRRPIEKGDAK